MRTASLAALMGAAVALAAPTYQPPVDAHALAQRVGEAAFEGAKANPLPLIAAVPDKIIHGDRDDANSRVRLSGELGTRDLSLTCGPGVDLVRLVLAAAGVPSRPVSLTAPAPLNHYDDGHILLEVTLPTGPALVDVDQKRLFLIGGRPASLAQIGRHGFGAVALAPLSKPARVDPAFGYAAYERQILASPRPWYNRMFSNDHQNMAA